MRLLEGLRLRVKDVEFERREIIVREAKGNKDRVTVLPENLIFPLKAHLDKVRALHERDLETGFGEVQLPDALAVKYPNALRAWGGESAGSINRDQSGLALYFTPLCPLRSASCVHRVA
jgi:integrase